MKWEIQCVALPGKNSEAEKKKKKNWSQCFPLLNFFSFYNVFLCCQWCHAHYVFHPYQKLLLRCIHIKLELYIFHSAYVKLVNVWPPLRELHFAPYL